MHFALWFNNGFEERLMKNGGWRRFAFGCISVICFTIIACQLILPKEAIVEFFKWVTVAYLAGQTITDFKKLNRPGG